MPASDIRLILDTNVVLRGLLNIRSASGKILEAVEQRRVLLLLSRPVLSEYRSILTDPEITERFPELTPEKVETALRRLRYLSEYVRVVRPRFAFPRDPRDEMLIELAIAAQATDMVTVDNDLLALPAARGEASKRFRQRLPAVRVSTPAEFLRAHARMIREP